MGSRARKLRARQISVAAEAPHSWSRSRWRQSLDVGRIRRELLWDDRLGFLVRFWSRWGDPLLTGALLALMAWAIVHGYTR